MHASMPVAALCLIAASLGACERAQSASSGPGDAAERFVRESLPELEGAIARATRELEERERRHRALEQLLEELGQAPAHSAPHRVQAELLAGARSWIGQLQAARARAITAWGLASGPAARTHSEGVLAAAVAEARALVRGGPPALPPQAPAPAALERAQPSDRAPAPVAPQPRTARARSLRTAAPTRTRALGQALESEPASAPAAPPSGTQAELAPAPAATAAPDEPSSAVAVPAQPAPRDVGRAPPQSGFIPPVSPLLPRAPSRPASSR